MLSVSSCVWVRTGVENLRGLCACCYVVPQSGCKCSAVVCLPEDGVTNIEHVGGNWR
jgi:hypothetical protein